MPLPLPPPTIRMNDRAQRDDAVYLRTARDLARVIEEMLALDRFSAWATATDEWSSRTILDFGCATGRLLAGLDALGRRPHRYIGVDIQPHLIEWCNSSLAPLGNYEFYLSTMHNERYNPNGEHKHFKGGILPEDCGGVDLIVARSVFTHMTATDTRLSLEAFRNAISPDGRAYVTVNVSNAAPAWRSNPHDPKAPSLLIVEFNKSYFEYIVEDCGFTPAVFSESVENQCAYLLRPVT